MTNKKEKYIRNGEKDLADTVHWRRIKNTASKVLKRCKSDISKYDSENICCYTSYGSELQGNNVSYIGLDNGASCFVSNNQYNIFEFANKNNVSSYEGAFFVLAQNVSFDYWLALRMDYTIDISKSLENKTLLDHVVWKPLGQYDVGIFNEDSGDVTISLSRKAGELNYDYSIPAYSTFDTANNRKRAYHTSSARILAGLEHRPHSKTALAGGKKVTKFHKKKKTNNK